MLLLLVWQWKGPYSNKWRKPLGSDSSLQLTVSKETGASILQLQGAKFWQEWTPTWIFLQSLKTKIQLEGHLNFSLVIIWAENLAMPCWHISLIYFIEIISIALIGSMHAEYTKASWNISRRINWNDRLCES